MPHLLASWREILAAKMRAQAAAILAERQASLRAVVVHHLGRSLGDHLSLQATRARGLAHCEFTFHYPVAAAASAGRRLSGEVETADVMGEIFADEYPVVLAAALLGALEGSNSSLQTMGDLLVAKSSLPAGWSDCEAMQGTEGCTQLSSEMTLGIQGRNATSLSTALVRDEAERITLRVELELGVGVGGQGGVELPEAATQGRLFEGITGTVFVCFAAFLVLLVAGLLLNHFLPDDAKSKALRQARLCVRGTRSCCSMLAARARGHMVAVPSSSPHKVHIPRLDMSAVDMHPPGEARCAVQFDASQMSETMSGTRIYSQNTGGSTVEYAAKVRPGLAPWAHEDGEDGEDRPAMLPRVSFVGDSTGRAAPSNTVFLSSRGGGKATVQVHRAGNSPGSPAGGGSFSMFYRSAAFDGGDAESQRSSDSATHSLGHDSAVFVDDSYAALGASRVARLALSGSTDSIPVAGPSDSDPKGFQPTF